MCTESGDDTDSNVRKIGVATKRLSAVHIRQVCFDKRNASALKRVSQGNTGVGITCGINDNEFDLFAGSVNLINQCTFAVGLKDPQLVSGTMCTLTQSLVDICQRIGTIMLCL